MLNHSMINQFIPAKVLSYNKQNRTCQVAIQGLTDGLDDGLTASIAYPVGDDDKDTDRLISTPADAWVFFESGDIAYPVVAFFRSHSVGAVVDSRRIRQQNIELLANKMIKLNASQSIGIETPTLNIKANINIDGNLSITGNTNQNGAIVASSVTASGVGLATHTHAVLSKDFGITGTGIG